MGFLSDIFDPGRKDRKAAAALAKKGIIEGTSVSGPGGISAGFDFTNNRGALRSSLGSWAPMLEAMQGGAMSAFSQAAQGLDPRFQGAADNTVDRLGQINVNRLSNETDFNMLGDLFRSNAAFAQRDVFDVGDEISSRLRALSERRNQRLVNKKFDQLRASGGLAHIGGAGALAELDRNLFEEGLQFDLAGLNFGRTAINDAFGRALGASGQREAIGARQFGEEMGLEQLGGARALQQFGINQQMFENLLRQQQQGNAMGMGLMSGAMGLSQLPLAFLQAAQGATGQASNSLFAAAGINQQNAAMAKSPFLEALNAAGSFMNSIAPGGFAGNPVGGP